MEESSLRARLAAAIPYFPYKKLERFYDIQGLLANPLLFDAACEALAERYKHRGITKIAAFEARGFLFSPVALKMNVPFLMLRKSGKMPNTISSAPYTKEYDGCDVMCIQRDALEASDKVLLIDDLLATGGTLCSGIELVKSFGCQTIDCCTVVELTFLGGKDRSIAAGATDVWSILTEKDNFPAAKLPVDYVDDGAAH